MEGPGTNLPTKNEPFMQHFIYQSQGVDLGNGQIIRYPGTPVPQCHLLLKRLIRQYDEGMEMTTMMPINQALLRLYFKKGGGIGGDGTCRFP